MASKPLCILYYLLLAGGLSVVSGFTPVTYPASSSECGQYDPLQDEQLNKIIGQVQPLLDCLTPTIRSCQEILHCFPSAPSGYYPITAPNGSLVQVYCDMEGTNCGGEGGWTRVAYVNMSQSGATCPQGLTQFINSGLTLCGRSSGPGCKSTVFSTLGLNYSKVCGQLRGYQLGAPDAFHPYYLHSLSIDDAYVDGVSITYGSAPRKHIWTYANGLNFHHLLGPTYECPCNWNISISTPPFVGSDYYCETAVHNNSCCHRSTFFLNDPLWDGQQCPGVEAPCCTHPNMPWFHKTLSETTTEDIELRVCSDDLTTDEDSPLEVIEIFVAS